MISFDSPSISNAPTKENMQMLKGYLGNLSDQLNYIQSYYEKRLDELEKEIKELKER